MDTDVTDLSGGQRTKILLAKLLLEKPDILLLDEPTNYLDAEHIAWLKRYLQEYENAFVLISHDIPFLNDVINIVYHVENQDLVRYAGDYDNFQSVYAMKKAQLEAAYERQQKEIADLQDFVKGKSYAWTLYFPNKRPRYWLRPPFDQGSFESYLRTKSKSSYRGCQWYR